ncbi:serine O-acetyltransferase EpsC [Vagococcus elongatus]|uniref:Serine acetyltransferase n=1 Tax=Vagococcus elongatus TaxID=180344 RepID=A0A430B1F3_9ENTE|nr:serine O-acetyltransferase EpsC [Vagococcus elongatus]RSU14081.1 serine O-acetyltransferase [Vagococcus elongatus]
MNRLKEDILTVKKHDPAARYALEIILTYPGLHALWLHRLTHFLHRHKLKLIGRMIATFSRFLTGIEIHPGAQIGRRVFIDHGMGLVIGETAKVGNDVVLFHGVTLGGTGKDRGKRHPTLLDGAYIAAHAQILGPITIGKNSKIGASSVVLKSIPDNATAVGLPAKVVRLNGKRVEEENMVK